MDHSPGESLILKNRSEALRYLQRRGYKISTGRFYQDAKAGLVEFEPDGTLAADKVELYARRRGLERLGMDSAFNGELSELHELKLQREIEKLEWENKKRAFEYEREQGKYIPRELLELELASRAAVLDSQLRTKIRARAKEWAVLVKGRVENVPELVTDAHLMLDQAMNEFARMDRFTVIFENEELIYKNQ